MARLSTDPELVREAARRAIEPSNEAIARTLSEDVGAYHAALAIGELMGMHLLSGPDSPREQPVTIDPPLVPLPDEEGEETVVMDEMGPAYGYPGLHGGGLPEETFRKIDEQRAAEYAALADDAVQGRVDALASRAVLHTVREVAEHTASVDADATGASGETISLERASRFVDGVTAATVDRLSEGTGNPEQTGEQLPPLAGVDDRHEEDASMAMLGLLSSRQTGHLVELGRQELADDFASAVGAGTARYTEIDGPQPDTEDEWQDVTTIMDEMEPPIGVSDGASPAPEAFEAADRKLASDAKAVDTPIMDEMEPPIGVSDGASPSPEAFEAADRRITSRYVVIVLAFLLLAFGGWYFLSRLLDEDTNEALGSPEGTELEQVIADEPAQQAQQQQSAGATVTTTAPRSATGESGPTPLPRDGDGPVDAPVTSTSSSVTTIAATPPPDASSTSTTSTAMTRTVMATVVITHEGGTTTCELALTASGDAEGVSHSMSMRCADAPADALGLFSMARPVGGTEQVVIDSREFGVVGIEFPGKVLPIDAMDGFESYAIWTAEYGPTNQITSAVSSEPEVVCELRNAPEGTAGTHAADCSIVLRITP